MDEDSTVAPPTKPLSLRARLRTYPWGEATLWFLFACSWLVGAGGDDTAAISAGVAALAAIGVRATRAERSGQGGE